MKKKVLWIVFVIIILLVLFGTIYIFIKNNNYEDNYDYKITVHEGSSLFYYIYGYKDDIIVQKNSQNQCITDPCPAMVVDTYKLKFSTKNMKKITKYLKKLFNDNNISITLYSKNNDATLESILESIVNNDESLLNNSDNNFVLSKNKYRIITDYRWTTLQNDGGSYYNIYYEVDLEKNIVKKYEDHYVGFQGYDYKDKVIYTKNIDRTFSTEFKSLLNNLIEKEDSNDTSNYNFYSIETINTSKKIYNVESIKSLQEFLNKIDNL